MKIIQTFWRIIWWLLKSIVLACRNIFRFIANTAKPPSPYSGAFMTNSDRRELLSKKHSGFVLGAEGHRLSLADSYRNTICYGASGSGKSTALIIPTMLQLEHSAVVFDIGNVLYKKTSGFLAHKGFTIKRIDLDDAAQSETFNPLLRCDSVSQLKQLSNTLIETALASEKSNDPFWNGAADQLLFVLLQIIKESCTSEHQTLANVRHLLNHLSANPKSAGSQWIARNASDTLFQEAKALLTGSAEKTIDSTLMTIRIALEKLADPTIAALTSSDSLGDFHTMLRDNKTVLYLGVKEATLSYNSFLLSLLLNDLFSALQKAEERTASPVLLMLDECGQIFSPALPTALTTLRKRNVGICLALQSRSQLVHLYGAAQANTMLTGGVTTHVYLPGQCDFKHIEELSRMMGLHQVIDTDGQPIARPLMAIDELITEKEASLIIQSGNRPLRMKLRRYYKNRRMRKRSEIPPYEMPLKPSPEPVLMHITPAHEVETVSE